MAIIGNARVQVVIEIPCTGGSWGEECSIGQLVNQAKRDALEQLQLLFQKGNNHHMVIVGEPKVIGVLTEEKK